jgi:predicted porin
MKKSLIALAALTAFAGAASAQSTVTIGGKLDLGFGKSIGSSDKGIQDAGGSRLNFLITEDLGGGLKAIGGFEHRLNPDDGTSASSNFWNGFSWVGLQGGFGKVTIGRMYTSAFTGGGSVQNNIDPFGGDTVAALRGPGMLPGGVGKVRNGNAIRYDVAAGGLNFSADVGEKGKTNAGVADGSLTKAPWSFSVNYTAGSLFLGFSHENPGDPDDKLTNLGARFGMGALTLRAGMGTGTNAADAKVRGYLLGADYQMGAGNFRFGYATSKVAGATNAKKIGIGYHYDLSKRTKLYADFARDSVPTSNKTGYDFGIQHNF